MELGEQAGTPDTVRCGACAAAVAARLTGRCAWCRRVVCAACLRTYGHYQLVCQDCHLGDW